MGAIRSGTVIAGKYRLEAVLGKGGMGSVWSARHLALETRLAIKFIGPEVAGLEEARLRFEREAKIAALLHSPHVVQIHDYGVDAGVPYLVMELLDGEDLGARLARQGRLGPIEAVSVVTQVARALRRAADAGIVHRDLKPANVFIMKSDDDEEIVKVLDFGVAKALRAVDDETTGSGVMIGSPRYMSPEQVRGSRLVDHRSDLWSLAVIAYRALTGQLPFQGVDVADLILKICGERAAPPSHAEPALGPDVDAFFARALAPDPDQRFQTAREFALAFADAIGEAPPPSVSVPNLTLYARASLLPPRPAAGSRPSISLTSTPAIEITRPSFAAAPPSRRPPPPVDPRERDTSPEPFASTRASDPEGTLTSAPRSLPARPRRRSPRVPLGYAIAAFAVVLAGLAGVFVGRAASPGAAAARPSAVPAPLDPSAAPPREAPPPVITAARSPSPVASADPSPPPAATVVPVLSTAAPPTPRAPAPYKPRPFQKYVPTGI